MKKRNTFLLGLVFMLISSVGWGQEKWIDENIQAWTSTASYGNHTQTISVGEATGDVIMTACNVSPTGAASGTGTTGFVQVNSGANNGSIELPEVNNVSQVKFRISAFGANRSMNLQKKDGETWETLTTLSGIGTTGETFTHDVDQDSPITLRLANVNQAVKVHDIIIYTFADPDKVAAPTFNPGTGNYFEPFEVEISTVTEDATIRYSFDSDEGPWTVYNDEDRPEVTETSTIWAYATKDAMDDSDVSSATYTFPLQVANIAALRAGATDGTLYELTGEAVLTFQTSNRNQKYIQDATGAILIDDDDENITTSYDLYDGIEGLIGSLNEHQNMLQFIPVTDPGPASTVGNIIEPEVVTLEDLDDSYEAKLVKVLNATIDPDGDTDFAVANNYDITDATATGILRTNYSDLNYINEPIPLTPQDIVGVVHQRFAVSRLVPRNLDDFEEADIQWPVTFYVDMTDADAFTEVQIAGSFEGWTGTVMSLEENNIYSFTTDAIFDVDDEILFKFRKVDGDIVWEGGSDREYTVVAGDNAYHAVWNVMVPAEITYANLQWPASGTISAGSNHDVYAQVFANELTGDGDVPNLQAWIGYNTENTDPATWESENWFEAAYSAGDHGNNDEYMFNLGSEVAATGTYYYASRFKLGLADFVYGGFAGGFWDGTTNVSGVLNILADEPDAQATAFDAAEDSESAITLTWTDADPAADGYLVKASATSYAAIEDPVDGEAEADGDFVKNVAAGVETVQFTDLLASTQYYFKIFAYNGSGGTINYKTDDVPEATATTEEAPLPPGLPYAQDFADFVSTETLPEFWSLDDTYSYQDDFGSGTAGGLRGNGVLGFQLTGSAPNNNFTATLTLLNNTGVTIEELFVSYTGKVARETQTGTPKWVVSIDGTEYEALEYSTEDGVDKSVTYLVTGLNIPNLTTFELEWFTTSTGTSGTRRQIGLTDLYVSATQSYNLIGASDNGSLYGGTWSDGDNEGVGFGAWDFNSGGNGAFEIANPADAGISGMSSTSFALSADGVGSFATADRSFAAPLSVGGTFTVDWGVNWDSDGPGNKGFDLYSGGTGGTQLININMGGSAAITINGAPMFAEYGTDAMTIGFEYVSPGNLRVYATGRNGVETYDETLAVAGPPDALRFYIDNMSDDNLNRQSFFNNFSITTDPTGFPANATVQVYGHVELATDLDINNLTIENGNLLGIAPGTSLDVSGVLTNNAGSSGLLIQSDASGTASLIHHSNNVQATIQRYINGGGYHLVSVPLTGGATAGLFMHSYLYEFDAVAQAWVIVSETPEDPIDSDKGYMIWYTGANTTFSFSGGLNNGLFEPQINSAAAAELFNLVPNPFPSAMDWDAAGGWTKDNLVNAVYIWNRQAADVENPNGQWASYIDGASTNDGSRYIPVGQSFFVETDGLGAPDLAMNNDVRVHSDQAFFKSQQEIPDMLRIHAQTENGTDEMVVRLHSDATDAFDSQFDASKIYGSSALPQLYSISSDDRRLSINSLPLAEDATVVPVALEWDVDGEVTLAFTNIHSFEPTVKLFLEDQLTGQMIDLREQNSYKFMHSESNNAQRFMLHLYDVVSVDEIEAASTHRIWNHHDRMYVSIPAHAGERATIELFDLLGKKLLETDLKLEDPVSLHMPATGIVVVRVTTGNEVFTNKLFIR